MENGKERLIVLRCLAVTAVLFLLLMLGILLPLWMEYKSLSAPVRTRTVHGGHAPAFDSRKQCYCPACGAVISVPQWDDSIPQLHAPRSAVKLGTLAPSAWSLPFLSTGIPRPAPETISDGGDVSR